MFGITVEWKVKWDIRGVFEGVIGYFKFVFIFIKQLASLEGKRTNLRIVKSKSK